VIAHEHHHNTREQAESYLAGALDLLDAVGPPDDLREAFFTKAVDLLSTKHVVLEQATMGGPIDLSNHRRLGGG
jgi:hypothetical protein